MKVIFSEVTREEERLRKRMDRFDSVVHEYLRSTRMTVDELAKRAGCNASSLWRYRKRPEYFRKAPLDVVATCLRLGNVSTENLRYILGLPTGKANTDDN